MQKQSNFHFFFNQEKKQPNFYHLKYRLMQKDKKIAHTKQEAVWKTKQTIWQEEIIQEREFRVETTTINASITS